MTVDDWILQGKLGTKSSSLRVELCPGLAMGFAVHRAPAELAIPRASLKALIKKFTNHFSNDNSNPVVLHICL